MSAAAAPSAPFEPKFGAPPITWQYDSYGLLQSCLEHNEQQGATMGLAAGRPGSGKSTFLSWLEAWFVWNGEIVVHRGRHADSWHRFPGRVKIYSNYPLAFTKTRAGERVGERAALNVTMFGEPSELLDLLEPGQLNVVYMRERTMEMDKRGRAAWKSNHVWLDFLHLLAHKPDNAWWALFLDEIHEVVPSYMQADDWHVIRQAAEDVADLRKKYVSLWGGTHYYADIDDKVLAKLQYFAWMRGSRLPSWSALQSDSAVATLPTGTLILDDKANFVEIPLPPLRRIDYALRVDEDLYPEGPVNLGTAGGSINPGAPSARPEPVPPTRQVTIDAAAAPAPPPMITTSTPATTSNRKPREVDELLERALERETNPLKRARLLELRDRQKERKRA